MHVVGQESQCLAQQLSSPWNSRAVWRCQTSSNTDLGKGTSAKYFTGISRLLGFWRRSQGHGIPSKAALGTLINHPEFALLREHIDLKLRQRSGVVKFNSLTCLFEISL